MKGIIVRWIGRGLAAVLVLSLPFATARAADPPLMAAAASVKFALEEAATAYAAETGERVRLSFGSSGNAERQIRQGAPHEVFLSADERHVEALAADGLTRDEGVIYGIGRIVLFVPHGSPLRPDGTLADLREALADGRLGRLAIANPEHAPYGQRAEEALRHAGLWEAIAPHLVLGENVAQAALFATSGNADGALIALSLALSAPVAARGTHGPVPADWHAPLGQRMVLLRGAGPAAVRFYDWLRGPAARAIFVRHGFALPGEG